MELFFELFVNSFLFTGKIKRHHIFQENGDKKSHCFRIGLKAVSVVMNTPGRLFWGSGAPSSSPVPS